ncbi:MAG: hypothetical protein JO090_02250 [Rhizobacter sp.]|nr:hypothetical protein [Rhizobacter sp.]
MREVVQVLTAMGSEQLFLALVFLASYSLALGEFATPRARSIAAALAFASAVGFAALSQPWEAGVILLGFGFVGVAVFTGAAWLLWMATPREASVPAVVQELAVNAPIAVQAASSRVRNTAPILNSPAAE